MAGRRQHGNQPQVQAQSQAPQPGRQTVVHQQVSIEAYQGPVPHPSIVEGYEKILPGAADRIFRMAERQQEHRMDVEGASVNARIADVKRGQYLGFVLGMTTIIGGVFLLYTGHDIAGYASLLTAVGLLIGPFLVNRKKAAGSGQPQGQAIKKQ